MLRCQEKWVKLGKILKINVILDTLNLNRVIEMNNVRDMLNYEKP